MTRVSGRNKNGLWRAAATFAIGPRPGAWT